MQDHVINSHRRGDPNGGLPRNPFALSARNKTRPSTFQIDFITESQRYSYGYEADSERFLAEWLFSFPLGRKQILFERHLDDFRFGRNFRGQNKTIEGLTRKNSLFVSAAVQNGHEEASKVYNFFGQIRFGNTFAEANIVNHRLPENNEVDVRTIRFLGAIGTGVINCRKREVNVSPESRAFQKGLIDLAKQVLQVDLDSLIEERGAFQFQLGHTAEGEGIEYFDLENESAGTRRLLVLLDEVFSVLDSGSLIVVDELDASLHTKAAEALVELFLRRNSNPKGAQLIATVHDTNILRSASLRRDQIWFTEKSDSGASSLYPLSDFRTRKHDNFEKGYLEGRYGAVPFSGTVSNLISDL